jgi:hypothetical protein
MPMGGLLRKMRLFLHTDSGSIVVSVRFQFKRFLKKSATHVKASNTGTSTRGPIVAASAWSEPTPYTAIAIAIASS